MITVKKLDSGYVLVRGRGPCNWAQPSHWPCTPEEIRASASPEASEEFLLEAERVASELLASIAKEDSNG